MEGPKSIFRRLEKWYPGYLTMAVFMAVHSLAYELSNHLATPDRLHPIWCRLDEVIGVHPWWVLPYCSWFVLLIFTAAWLLWKDTSLMRRFGKYCMITSILTVPVFFIWPTCVLHRPAVVEGTGISSALLRLLYSIDNNACVMPSLHVIWAFGMLFAMWNDRTFAAPAWRLLWTVQTILISLSTAFTKQHSVLDTVFAVPYILLAWYLSFRPEAPEALPSIFPLFRRRKE